MTTKDAQKLLNTKRKDSSILFHEDYKSDKERHSFKCKKCFYIWESSPNLLKRKENVGCPNCYEIVLQSKKEKKEFTKIRGATKLLNSHTLSLSEISASAEKINEINNLKRQLEQNKKFIEMQNQKILNLQENYNEKSFELNKQLALKTHFGFFFGLILFPIWLWYQYSFDEKVKPYQERMQKSKKELDDVLNQIKRLSSDVLWDERCLKQSIESLEYEKNILRLQNRIIINQGGKTKLYYFRFHYNEKKYYKIGISTNGVYSRYKNKDGTEYGRIEKIFFDTNIREAERIEQLILHVFKEKLAKDKNLLATKGGYSEVFISDILGLDTYS
ncbi:MAG: hypothetical protein WC272_02280 [Sulfurimonas sp.]|jgi:hypothetical protein